MGRVCYCPRLVGIQTSLNFQISISCEGKRATYSQPPGTNCEFPSGNSKRKFFICSPIRNRVFFNGVYKVLKLWWSKFCTAGDLLCCLRAVPSELCYSVGHDDLWWSYLWQNSCSSLWLLEELMALFLKAVIVKCREMQPSGLKVCSLSQNKCLIFTVCNPLKK